MLFVNDCLVRLLSIQNNLFTQKVFYEHVAHNDYYFIFKHEFTMKPYTRSTSFHFWIISTLVNQS